MKFRHIIALLAALLVFAGVSYADAPLKSSLDLSTEQARQVDQIQKKYRQLFAAKRGEFNRESRKLRRARIANDSIEIAQQTRITEALEAELRQIKLSENDQIRQLLTPEQKIKFAAVIERRRDMVGSSRDARIFE